MKKVIIIGCPGSGKSTFARKLKEKTQLPLYYLDMIWHKPDKTNVSQEEFDQRIKEIICKDEWIIDGNYLRTLDKRLKNCDTIFLLDIPLETCLLGVEARIGKNREDMPWIETEFDKEFKQWICDFGVNQLPQIYKLLDKYGKGKNIKIFKTRKEIEEYLNLKNYCY